MYTLQIASKEFFAHCRFEKNLSPKTLKAYEIDLTQLQKFLSQKEYSLEIKAITKIELREYLAEIATLKPKSIKRKIATIKAMFNYLEFEDRITVSPLRKMRINIKEAKVLPKTLTLNEMQGIFKSAYGYKEEVKDGSCYQFKVALRDIAVVELLFATGGRVSEIANMQIDSIDLDSGDVVLKGKGNKERIIQICNKETLNALRTYHKVFHEQIVKAQNYFLINRFGHKLSDQSIRIIVKRLAENAGVTKHVTPHCFRHSFGTLLLENDVDIKYIQLLLGHSSIMTTQIYTHVNREKQKQILRTKHPRKNFQMHYTG